MSIVEHLDAKEADVLLRSELREKETGLKLDIHSSGGNKQDFK